MWTVSKLFKKLFRKPEISYSREKIVPLTFKQVQTCIRYSKYEFIDFRIKQVEMKYVENETECSGNVKKVKFWICDITQPALHKILHKTVKARI